MAPPVYPANTGFLLAEDAAVKRLFQHLVVPNDKGEETPVPVWFRWPTADTQIIYPMTTLDLVGIEPAQDLWHSEYPHHGDFTSDPSIGGDRWYRPTDIDTGQSVTLYDPSTDTVVGDGSPYVRRNYLAYRLYYQASLWSSTAVQDRIMTARVVQWVVRPGPMWLYVEADDTYRRTEFLGWQPADVATQKGGKRLFRKIVTFSVQAEIPQDYISEIAERVIPVERVLLKGTDMDSEYTWTASDANVDNTPGFEEIATRQSGAGQVTATATVTATGVKE